jgi:hypothetical protein
MVLALTWAFEGRWPGVLGCVDGDAGFAEPGESPSAMGLVVLVVSIEVPLGA